MLEQNFSAAVLVWFKNYGRKNLPWQQQPNAYKVWVSEIMLQQTQVKTVIPYYEKFISRFPTLKSLAESSVDNVLSLWTGLGYYARARNLHKAAQIIQSDYHGIFPSLLAQLVELPGIGLSTAGAVLSLGMGKHAAILDANCKRVYARCYAIAGYPGRAVVAKQLWQLAENLTPHLQTAQYNQAMMDLGSMICIRTQPVCLKQPSLCPIHKFCQAAKTNSVLDYPEKKKAKKIPERKATFLILIDQKNKVFLEQRPPSGIWGGLWCFPQFIDKAELFQWLKIEHISYSSEIEIKEQQHVFSHFRLKYSAFIIKSTTDKLLLSPGKVADETRNHCFAISNALQLGLATPIKKLLQTLQNSL
ncbi:MAG: A/G-specific adenine glycosylase [Pseudomonadota bacterium]